MNRTSRCKITAVIATASAVALCLMVTQPSESDAPRRSSAATISSAELAPAVSKGEQPNPAAARLMQAALPADLREMKSGTSWEVPLPSGRTVQAHVNLGKADEMFASQWLVGGDLGGVGTFFLSQDKERDALDGWFILYGDPEAWRVVADEAGNPALVSQPVSSIVCLPPGTNVMLAPAGASAGGGAFVPDIPIKSSRPTSPSVLFLDFRGGTITIAGWNNGSTINYAAPCFDRTLFEKVINRVAEFYVPFDVNVTTDPTLYSAATPGRRMRCIVARDDIGGGKIEGGIGGVAHTGDYRKAGNGQAPCDAVCWAFANPASGLPDLTIVQRLGNSIAHELGHTLGLLHWSTSAYSGSPGEYYPAADLQQHGPGGTDGWAPLMGDFNYAGLIQWAKGEYLGAENRGLSTKQDDLAVIADSLGVAVAGGTGPGGCVIPAKPSIQAWWPDDQGDTRAAAADLRVSGVAPADGGVIGTSTDLDYSRIITIAPGDIRLEIKPLLFDGPLDIYAELQNASGTPIVTSDPALTRSATLNANGLPAGTYYLLVRGDEQANKETDGWSRYGSLGTYRITGTISGAPNPAQITASDPPPPGSVGVAYNFPLQSTFAPTSYYATSGVLPPGLGLSNDAVSGIPTQAGVYTINLAVANAAGGTAKSFTFTIYGSATLPDALDAFSQDWLSSSPPTSPPAALWQGQRLVTRDGTDAARSGSIGSNSESILRADFTGPGLLTFYWRTSSHSGDKLILKVDATEQPNPISGINSWTQKTVTIPNGTHTVSWIYRTDPGTTEGDNAGYVDQVSYVQVPQYPNGNFYAAGIIGKPFAWQIQATGSPTSWALTGGALPPGISLNPSTGVLTGTPTATGVFDPEISATNAGGTSTTYPTVYVYPDIALPVALDNAGLSWSVGGSSPWLGDTSPNHDGTDAAHSGPIRHGLNSWLQTTVSGPGTLTFWWKVSSELNGDPVTFSIDGVSQAAISGEVDWTQRTFAIPAGSHALRWEFTRDNGGNGGQNMAWLDQVSWITPGPTITSPLTVNWTVGQVAGVSLTSDDPNAVWSVSGTVPDGVFFLDTSKYIGAVPRRSGTYSFTLMATNLQGTTTSRTFTMYIKSSYTAWAESKGLPAGSELGDNDKDGIPNIAELAYGLDPFVRNAPLQLVTFNAATKRLEAKYLRRHQYYPDLRYEVQVSSNLISWTTIAVSEGSATTPLGAFSVSEVQVAPFPDPIVEVTVVDGQAQSAGNPRRAMRVKIIQL